MLEYAAALDDALHVVGSQNQEHDEGPHDQPLTEMFCQVPGCGFNLTECSYYVKRHRVCQAHMKAKIVALAGENCRFCQQCGRFQPLSDFKEDRKSCDAALRAHNARRRMMHRDSSSLLQDRPRSISSRSRSRGQPSSEPEQAQNGPAVQRRSARRSSSFRSEPDPNQDLLRAVRRMSGSAGRETRSDGDQARARGSKSPSCSLQTSEEAVQQPQGHEQQPPSTTADAPGSPAAGTQSCQPACWPWSATSMDAAWGVQPSSGVQPGRYELKGFQGIRPIGAAGSSRLGLSAANSTAAASGPPAAAAQANAEPFNGFTPVSFDWLQQQQSQQQQQQQQQIDSTCTLPAYCGSMSISSAPCNTQHQGTLAGWMSQHSWQGAQQMWAAGIGDACSMPVLAQPSTLQHAGSMQQQQEQLLLRVLQQQQQQQACLPLHDSSTLQQHQQQSQDGLTQQVTADTNATSHLKHSGGMQQSVLQQQQPSPLQQQQQQQQQQHHQQQQQEQEQEPTRVQQEQRPSLQQQQQRQLQERIHSPEQLLQGRRHSSQQLQDQSWLDQLLLEFNAGPAPPALDALCPDSAAASTGPLHAANSLARHGSAAGCQAERVDPAVAAAAELLPGAPEDPLADALDLVEVLLAGDPDWQVVQASSAATVSTSTYPATTIGSSTPSSSNVVLNNPSGRLSDLSLVLQGFLPGGCIAMTEAAGQAPAPALLDAAAAAAARAAEAVPLNPAAVAAGLISPSAFGKPHQYSGFFAADAADAAAADSSFPSSAQHRQQPQMLMLPSNVLQEPVAGSMHTEATPTSLAAGSQAHSMPGALLTPLQAVSLGIAALSDPGAAAAAVPASSNLPAVDAQYSHAGYGSDAMAVDLDGTVPVLQLSTQLSRPEQEQPQQSELLSPVQSSALLQQQLELAQQQLLHQQQQQQLFLQHQQQQEQLQLMLRQQQQQTQQQQQQPAAMQHQLVRLSLKLHGVTPDQLPSITVQSMQSLLSRHAGNLDAIMLQPAFRQGCVQTEFDILVKPSWVADTQPLWLQRQQMAASRGDSPPAAAAGVVHDSKASMAWSAVVDALSLCPVTAAAEAQLREALPFRLLLQTLLDLPLVGSSSAEEQHADRHSSSSSSGDRHQMNSAAAEGTVGSRVRSVFAQIGGCMGMWCADGDVLQDWTPGIAGRTVAIEDSSSSSDGVVAGSWRPQVLAAGPLCVAAGADHSAAGGGSWAAGQAWQPLLLDVAVQAGCSDGVYDDTASSGTASSSSTAGSSGRDGVESKPRLWCTRRGLFQPVAGRLEAEASAGAAAAAAVGSPDVIVGLDGALPGLLLLQAEQLNHVSSSGSSALGHADLAEGSGIEGGEDPVPCMSSLVPVVVCPSAAMAAEVEGLLLHAVDSTHAGRLLQQLGLALDCWTLIKQQQQQQLRLQEQHLGLSEREQWCRALLSNQQYLNVIRSACNDWLLLATLHSMPATVACLNGIVHSLTGHTSEQAAPAAGVAADVTEAAVTPQPEPGAAASEGAAESDLAASGTATASRVGDTAVRSGQERHAAAAVLQGSASASATTSPVHDWVFEDVAALKDNSSHGSGSSRDVSVSSSSKAEGMQSQGVDGTAAQRHWAAWAKQHSVLLTLLLVLALVLMLLVLASVGQSQVQGLLLPVRIVWQFLQAASVPLAIIAMGWALACWVARQQQQQQAGLQRRGVQGPAARCDAVQEASSSKAAAGGEAQVKGGAV